ncbi:enoyl-CoA hydratase/isomerase family protein [Bradyrhizobium ivorense]|uniref:enoyl-CoA hydratase/isomerase family protein n=1 Tax=Bradyrhizobium ivorense TaxID=2511166 RepID=UPI003D31DE6B
MAVRAGLVEAVKPSDGGVTAIVIRCAMHTFISGEDIREFGKVLGSPALDKINTRLEDCPNPIVAAVHGVTFGGGVGLRLTVISGSRKDAKLGQLKVKLGLTPGGSGTQRLPRAIGPDRSYSSKLRYHVVKCVRSVCRNRGAR